MSRFNDRATTRLKHLDLFWIDVDTQHFMAFMCQTGSCHCANIPQSKYAYFSFHRIAFGGKLGVTGLGNRNGTNAI